MTQKQKFFELVPSGTNIHFLSYYKPMVAISVVLLLASIALMFTKGFNWGIDFTGGTVMQLRFANPTPIGEVRALIDSVGAEGATVVAMGSSRAEYMVTARSEMEAKTDSLPQRVSAKAPGIEIPQADIVGPKVGDDLKKAAMLSLFYSIVLIMIYIWLRFDFKFAPGATLAMMHDLVLVSGFYVLTGLEFDITAIAALLTVAGYSVNDTIVIYDRVRSLFEHGGDELSLRPTLERAINMTLSRTLITSGSTMVALIPIAFFCTGPIQAFAVALIVGVIVGTYSTIFIAAPMTLTSQSFAARSQAAKRPSGTPKKTKKKKR